MVQRDDVDDLGGAAAAGVSNGGSDLESGAEADAPDRDFPISSKARFSLRGKPLALDDFIDAGMGALADRERVAPQPQPSAQAKMVVWASRRPL